jgi:hypothetical protein
MPLLSSVFSLALSSKKPTLSMRQRDKGQVAAFDRQTPLLAASKAAQKICSPCAAERWQE